MSVMLYEPAWGQGMDNRARDSLFYNTLACKYEIVKVTFVIFTFRTRFVVLVTETIFLCI